VGRPGDEVDAWDFGDDGGQVDGLLHDASEAAVDGHRINYAPIVFIAILRA
jgi:hypothetical protein